MTENDITVVNQEMYDVFERDANDLGLPIETIASLFLERAVLAVFTNYDDANRMLQKCQSK